MKFKKGTKVMIKGRKSKQIHKVFRYDFVSKTYELTDTNIGYKFPEELLIEVE